ncbi:MAG: ATP-binding protein [Holophaga sp.]|nr:ATP-binding protein [Holophaga sp.]
MIEEGDLDTGTLEVAADDAGLGRILAFIGFACDRAGLAAAVGHDLRLAVEEVCTNIIRHGYAPGAPGPIRIAFREGRGTYEVVVEDRAPAFDPATAPAPDLTSGWGERRPGGHGWSLVRAMVDQVLYQPVPPRGNRVTLVKSKPGRP